jgi:hypothetical protein
MRKHTQMLDMITTYVCYIDGAKIYPGIGSIGIYTETINHLIDTMKLELMDIGELPRIVADIEAAAQAGNPVTLAMIEQAHNEIERLAGDEAHLIYSTEEFS